MEMIGDGGRASLEAFMRTGVYPMEP